jgi:acyl carrier protein
VTAAGVTERVLAIVASIVGERPLEPAASWRSVGLDSLDLLTLLGAVEDEFDLAIPDLVATQLRNVCDVVGLVLSAQS